MERKHQNKATICVCIVSALLAFYFWKYLQIVSNYPRRNTVGGAALFVAFSFFGVSIVRKSRWISTAYKWRWGIAGIAFLFCVCLNLNGSSIGNFSQYLQENTTTGLLFNRPLPIRSDEWAVWTPMAISQEYDGYQATNSLIGGGDTATQWVSMGGIPAWSLAALFKPLYWGFLFLGSERGFSILWNARWILLLMLTFECFMRLTKENKYYSAAAAFMVAFAPVVQWFFSQSIAELILFSEGCMLCLDKSVGERNSRKQAGLIALGAWQFGCLVMVAYPAWIIPQVYWMLALGIALWRVNSLGLNTRRKRMFAVGIVSFLVVFLVLLVIVYQTSDTLARVKASVYPGQRFITGGTGLPKNILAQISQIFFPHNYQIDKIGNPCEESGFIDFFPLGLILAIHACVIKRQKDPVLIAMLVFETILGIFVIIGFPDWLSRITLLSNCPTKRLSVVFGLIHLSLLFRSLQIIETTGKVQAIFLVLVSVILYGIMDAKLTWTDSLWIRGMSFCIFILIAVQAVLLCNGHNIMLMRLISFEISAMMLCSGIIVNPIQKGFDSIDTIPLIQSLRALPMAEDEMWLVEGPFPYGQIPLLAGKRTLNSDQEYANTGKWSTIDAEGKYADVYNRFAHIKAELVGTDETEFTVLGLDYIELKLNDEDMKKMHITHLMTRKEYIEESNGIKYEWLLTDNGFNVYKLYY